MKMNMGEGGAQAGFADGIRVDVEGNLYAAAGWVGPGYDGVHVFAPDGVRIGLILLPEICANVLLRRAQAATGFSWPPANHSMPFILTRVGRTLHDHEPAERWPRGGCNPFWPGCSPHRIAALPLRRFMNRPAGRSCR